MADIAALGWHWRQDGAVLAIALADGRRMRAFVPLRHIDMTFGKALAHIGCPVDDAIGDHSVGGWFSRIKRSVKRAARKVRKKVSKTVRRAGRSVYKRAAWAARKAARATQWARKAFTSSQMRALIGVSAMAFPALAPAAAGIAAAQLAMKRIDTGVKVARAVARGKRPTNAMRQAMALASNQRRAVQGVLGAARMGNPNAQRFVGALRRLGA